MAHSTNPFHLRNSWRSSFGSKLSTGERFQDFSSIADMVYNLAASVRHERKSKSGRRWKYQFDVKYEAYAANPLANFATIDGAVSFKSKSINSITLAARWLPRRVRKNYRWDDLGSSVFRQAPYSELSMELSKRSRLWRNLDVKTGLSIEGRNYSNPFINRDRRGFTASLIAAYKFSSRFQVYPRVEFGRVRTPSGEEWGIAIDRSFREITAGATVKYSTGRNTLAFRIRKRTRSYLSSNRLDESHYNRSDRLWNTRLLWQRKMTTKMRLWIQLDYASNSSNRFIILDFDSVPYNERAIGTGLSWIL